MLDNCKATSQISSLSLSLSVSQGNCLNTKTANIWLVASFLEIILPSLSLSLSLEIF